MCKKKYIRFGRFNKKYFFILGSILVKYLLSFIRGFTPYLTPTTTYYIFNYKPFFISHPLFTLCLQYFSICLGGVILELIYAKKNSNSEANYNLEYKATQVTNNYIPDGIIEKEIAKTEEKNDKKYWWRIFYVLSIYFFSEATINILNSFGLREVDYWPLEFIFLFIFSKKILNRTLYKHQKIPIIILIILCTIIQILNTFIPLNQDDCSKLEEEDLKKCEYLNNNIFQRIMNGFNPYFIPIFIIIYLAAMVGDSYYTVYNKWFTDIKYITIERILIYIGLIGFIYSLIFFFVFSYIPCNHNYGLFHNICKVEYDGKLFYDNFLELGETDIDVFFYIDIFATLLLFMIASFLNIFFEILIITYLDPFCLIPIKSVFNFIYVIIDYPITHSMTNKYRDFKFICNITSDTISVILSLIHLEIIEIHFCHCNRFLRRYIIKREIEDKSFIVTYNINDDQMTDM